MSEPLKPLCIFNRAYSVEGCGYEAENLDTLLAHVRVRHGAIAWTMATLTMALERKDD